MVGLELGRGGKNLSALIGLPSAAGKTVLCNGASNSIVYTACRQSFCRGKYLQSGDNDAIVFRSNLCRTPFPIAVPAIRQSACHIRPVYAYPLKVSHSLIFSVISAFFSLSISINLFSRSSSCTNSASLGRY